jgi:uncharacterized damage-inducible protein DinB
MPKNVEVKPDMTTMWKEEFMQVWDREHQTTMNILKAYPEDKSDLKPHEKLRSARELVWGFTNGEAWMINGALTGNFDMSGEAMNPPATMSEVIQNFEKVHRDAVARVRRMNVVDLNKTVKFFVGPKQMGNVKVTDLLAMMVMDQVHHRGQLSVYLRMANGKVPSIYGPTADEPWM